MSLSRLKQKGRRGAHEEYPPVSGSNHLELSYMGVDSSAYMSLSNFELSSGPINDIQKPVPAPGAILLGTLGTGLVGWLRRRRTL